MSTSRRASSHALGWDLGILVIASVLGITFITCTRDACLRPFTAHNWSLISLRIGLVAFGIAITQPLVFILRRLLRHAFDVPDEDEPVDTLPPRVVGLVENIFYPWLLFDLQKEGASAIAAWIGLKVVGNWKGWETPSRRTNARPTRAEINRGRRRVYVFALCNAAQVASACAVAWLMGLVVAK